MGVYSSCQFLGAGIGGAVGGWCYGQYGTGAVFAFCALTAFSWFLLSLSMQPPRYWANLMISLEQMTEQETQRFTEALLQLAGVETVTLRPEEAVAYLKVDNQRLQKDQLQALIDQYVNR